MINELDLVRDYRNNSLINNNKKAYEKAMMLKQKRLNEQEEINIMKQDLLEIKALLNQLLKEKNNGYNSCK